MSRLLALLVAPPAQRLLDAFTRQTGARIGIYDHAWNEVSVGSRRGACAYCAIIRGSAGRLAACQAEDRRRRIEAAERGALVAYRCHAGLDEAVMPLSEDGRLVGWIMVGQFRSGARLPARVLGAAWARGRRAVLERAFAQVPLARRRDDLLALFAAVVDSIAAQRLVAPRRDPLIDTLLAPGPTVTLSQAARLAGVGRTRLAERARAALGCGLRQAQVRTRLERAAQLMRSGSARTVAEAARRAGFTDPAYFSRLWTRHRGSPPSRFLRLSAPTSPDSGASR